MKLRNTAVVVGCVVALAESSCLDPTRPLAVTRPVARAWNVVGQAPLATGSSAATVPLRPVLDRYCVTCHNERLKTAGLLLDKADVEHVRDNAETWEKVVRKLRSGAMPPVGMPRPDKATYGLAASWLEGELDHAASHPNPGRPPVHRLNRAEYVNVVRDLLGVEVDARSLLPADDAGYGFDNVADVLSLSPALLERYLSAARTISRLAIGDRSIRPTLNKYKLPEAPVLMQDDRMGEDLPFGSRGGVAVRYHFPLDGEYVVKVRLQRVRDGLGEIRGLYEPTQLDIRLDGERIRLFSLGREVKNVDGSVVDPELVSVSLDLDDPERFEYESTADANLEVRFDAKAGTRIVSVAFIKKTYESESSIQPRVSDFGYARNKGGLPDIDSVDIGGPYRVVGSGDTPSRRKIFVCRPTRRDDERSCAATIVSTLVRRAYRRPTTRGDVETLLGFFKTGRQQGGFEAGIEAALARMLVDPDFLFRVERDPVKAASADVYRLSDLELASRLSFFLWSSIPDDELLSVAARGKLNDPAVLERQVRRMLADARSHALTTNFAGQWLYVRNLRTVSPDRQAFADFDENLREAFQRETELFFESIVREDRSALDLLTANYTFLNERLARHYGIPNVYGTHFRRVMLANDQQRGGLLGQGSILTVTSYATRTSPVQRGKWLLENILGAPPPPPPPNVPPLQENGDGGKALSMRAAMEQHRKNPACSSCHARMDPLGFALENFDGIGQWRDTDAGAAIDSSGTLPDGTKFSGVAQLRAALINHPNEFVATLVEKLLVYALGRGLEYYDAPSVRTITREAALENFTWSSLILNIVKSVPFQMRRLES